MASPSILATVDAGRIPGAAGVRGVAQQDLEAARMERKALVDAGLLHLLPARFAGEQSPGPIGSGLGPAGAATRSKIREALGRWAKPKLARVKNPWSTDGREITDRSPR